MTLFTRVVEAGSFSATARSLGQTRAAVSRQIASLEARLGVQLLHRTTRRMHLTEVGRQYYRHCAQIAERVETAEFEVASLVREPRGWLRVAAPITFGRRYLAPLVKPFTRRHPKVSIDISLSDAAPDLIADGFDVGVQITTRPDTSLVAVPLANSEMVVCGSPDYLARAGRPERPSDLGAHNCLVYSKLETPRLWRFRGSERVRVSGNFAVNHGETLLAATLEGLGVAYMPTFIAGPYIADGRLVVVLAGHARSNQQIFAVHPRDRNVTPKISAFVDFLRESFQPVPPWESGTGHDF